MRFRNYYLNRFKNRISYALRPGRVIVCEEKKNLDQAETVTLDSNLSLEKNRIYVGLVRDLGEFPYYPKFERFLKNNGISYDYIDIYSSTWIDTAKKFNVIIWRPMSSPWELEVARAKIYFLEQYLGKLVYPAFREIMFYENKIYQYFALKNSGFPIIETFISCDYDEVMDWIQNAEYPFVSKICTGSASEGVLLLKNRRQAKGLVERIFRVGAPTYFPSLKQKNYVFFQKYVENAGFDLRIIVIDENNIFGYYRQIPGGDFRASGMGLILKKELPKEAVKIALEITKKMDFTNLSVDLLQSSGDHKYYIIEASNFIRVETDEQLKINEIPGKYSYLYKKDSLVFERGKYWIQELILKKFFEKHFCGEVMSKEVLFLI